MAFHHHHIRKTSTDERRFPQLKAAIHDPGACDISTKGNDVYPLFESFIDLERSIFKVSQSQILS